MMKKQGILSTLFTTLAAAAFCVMLPTGADAAEAAPEHGSEITVTGEILDMACYIDHNATGEKHQDCAKKCIESGLPVGIKGEDGQVYLLVGEHKPANKEMAKYAAKTITVRGKFATRDGFKMIENIEIMKK